MSEKIYELLVGFAEWNTCPTEIRIPKEGFLRLYAEILEKTVVKIGTPMPNEIQGFWIDFNGPIGKVRIYPS